MQSSQTDVSRRWHERASNGASRRHSRPQPPFSAENMGAVMHVFVDSGVVFVTSDVVFVTSGVVFVDSAVAFLIAWLAAASLPHAPKI